MSQFSSAFRSTDATNTAYPTTVGAASVQAFPEVPAESIRERLIHNPSTSASLAIRLTPSGVGNPPAAALNTGGSITLAPGASFLTQHTGAIQMIGAGAGQPVTLMER